MNVRQVSPEDVHRLQVKGRSLDLVDVRTSWEFNDVHAEGARWVPLGRVTPEAVLADHPKSSGPFYVICRSGHRSMTACQRLQAAGLKEVFSVAGGTVAWERAGLPVVRKARQPWLSRILPETLLRRLGLKAG